MRETKFKVKNENGITLIALVITIIVLLILAGVTINLTLGDNGIFKVAEHAARNYKDAEEKELALLEQFETELGTNFEYNTEKGVNKPKLLDGMTPIKFNFNTTKNEYEEANVNEMDVSWYNYVNKQWANVETEDGSMWVWIPRYAYRINYTDATDKSKGGTVEVVFLIGTTDEYYDKNGEKQTAKRASSAEKVVDTTTDYTVHPAFTDESSINYANGGWDEELTGIWVAKFEAGYAGGNNTTTAKESNVTYTQTQVYVPAVQTGTGSSGSIKAVNYYGEYDKTTKIKYPVFRGISYSVNNISINDTFNISRALTESGNIYGLSASDADSHLMKNSEWGAVAYLSKSQYGLGTKNIYVNNATLNNTVTSVYAVTGCCGITEAASQVETTISEINARTETDIFVWSQENGQAASTTGTVYGVYDMLGGVWELTAGYVASGHANLKSCGESLTYNGNTLKTLSTKYTTVYPHDSTVDGTTSDINTASSANYNVNTKIYGDAVKETSISGTGAGWDSDYSYYWSWHMPFSARGGTLNYKELAGVCAFTRKNGSPEYNGGFRTVLVEK